MPSEIIIDSDSHPAIMPPPDMSKGMNPDGFRQHRMQGLASPFRGQVIPRNEWRDRCGEHGVSLRPTMEAGGYRSKDQNGTNFCWAFGVVGAMEVCRITAGLPHVELSPASIACPIKNWRNQGGWGDQAIEYIEEHGIMPESIWPEHKITKEHWTAENREVAKKYRITEWDDLSNDFELHVSCLLQGIPVAVGYNWWGHLVFSMGVRYRNGRFEIESMNSWSERYGDNGYFWIQEHKAKQGYGVAPRAPTAA